MTRIILGLLIVFSSNFLNAQDVQTKKLETFFDKIVTHDKAMGSVSVFKDGAEIYQRSFGYADVENNVFATKETKYKIGSISKMYTATLILKLVEEGKLKLNTKLNQFFPEIPNAHNITIKNLLNHSSGLFNYTTNKGFYEWAIVEHSRQDIIEKIIENGTVFQPNDRHEYSNTNFVLLAFITEKLHNKSFKEILQIEILDPIKLEQTQVGGKITITNKESYSYRKSDQWEIFPHWFMDNAIGAGSLIATPTDVNRFTNALFTYKILKKKTVEKMLKLTDYYGLGVFRYRFFSKQFYGHSGRMEKFRSLTAYSFVDGLSISASLNGSLIKVKDIVKAVLAIYQNKTYDLSELQIATLGNTEAIEGVYSGEGYPFKIKIFRKDDFLMAERTGQKAYQTDAVSQTEFTIKQFNVNLKFTPKDYKLEFLQNNKGYILYKEKTDN